MPPRTLRSYNSNLLIATRTKIVTGSTRVTSATLHLHVQAATNYTPITVQALFITVDNYKNTIFGVSIF